MGRILGIDYGRKRVGLAVTDPLQLVANNIGTVHSKDIWEFFKEYFAKEEIDAVVVGYPKRMNNEASEAVRYINPFLKKFRKTFENIPLHIVDERFSSKIAFQTMIDGGMKKKDRQKKENIDAVSAVIILQSFMEMKNNGLI